MTFTRLPFFSFTSLSYTTARNIENYAASRGAQIRVDPDGSRHPGSVCNKILRDIMRNPVAAKTLGLTAYSCVEVILEESNDAIQHLVDRSLLLRTRLNNGKIDLYTRQAAQVICATLLRDPAFAFCEQDFNYIEVPFPIVVRPKHLSPKSAKPVASLFDSCPSYRVIDTLTEQEQEAVRKYSRLVKETRAAGRKTKNRKEGNP